MVADKGKKKIRNVVRKICIERRRIKVLKDEIMKRLEEKVIEMVYVSVPNLWGYLKDGVLLTCDDICGKNRGWKGKGTTWWWNVEVKEANSRKKYVHRAMFFNSTVENRSKYKSKKNKAKKWSQKQ